MHLCTRSTTNDHVHNRQHALRYPCSMHLCTRSTPNDNVHNRQHRPRISPNVRRTCLDLACRPSNSNTCVSLAKSTTAAPPHPHAGAPETHNTRGWRAEGNSHWPHANQRRSGYGNKLKWLAYTHAGPPSINDAPNRVSINV